MTRWLITGATGMLGTDLVRALRERGVGVTAAGRAEVDITDPGAVDRAVRGHDVVVNAAAWSRVDAAQDHEAEAFAANARGPQVLAQASVAHGARLVHISTDYVFDGQATEPYAEDAPRAPRSAYGRSKAEGERLVTAANPDALIVRTAWLYGAHGPNFVKTMARLARDRDTVSVVADQVGQPTWTVPLAEAIIGLVEAQAPGGPWHATADGQISWFGFAQAIFAELGLDPDRVKPITTAEYPLPAPRPAYSVLGKQRWAAAGLAPLPNWRDLLRRAIAAGVAST